MAVVKGNIVLEIAKFQNDVVLVPFDTCVWPGAPIGKRFTLRGRDDV